MNTHLQQLSNYNPDVLEYGTDRKTAEGRSIAEIVINFDVKCEKVKRKEEKIAFFIDCGKIARDWSSTVACLEVIEKVLAEETCGVDWYIMAGFCNLQFTDYSIIYRSQPWLQPAQLKKPKLALAKSGWLRVFANR